MTSPGRIEESLVHALGGKPNKADFELVEKSPGHWYFKSWNGNFIAAEIDMKKLDE